MALSRMWRNFQNFRRWKKATAPMLFNSDTGELIPYSSYTGSLTGKWVLRRPLTLPGSTLPLFLETPLTTDDIAVWKSAGGPNAIPPEAGTSA